MYVGKNVCLFVSRLLLVRGVR